MAVRQMLCPAGTSSNGTSGSCTDCRPGYFSSAVGGAACQACPPGNVQVRQEDALGVGERIGVLCTDPLGPDCVALTVVSEKHAVDSPIRGKARAPSVAAASPTVSGELSSASHVVLGSTLPTSNRRRATSVPLACSVCTTGAWAARSVPSGQ